jgi:hypothetical protein
MTKTNQVKLRRAPIRNCRLDTVPVYKPVSSPKKDKFCEKVKKMVQQMREEHRLLNERMAEALRLADEEDEEELRQFTAQLVANKE